MKILRATLGGRGFSSSEPVVVATISILAPCIWSKSEIICQQIGELGRGFSGEDPLHQILMIGIPFRLPQKNPLARLRAENVLAPVVCENPCGIPARRAGA